MMTTIQPSVTSAGCSAGSPVPTNGLGFPHSWRVAAVRVLTGFLSATGRRKSGSVYGGTKTLDTNVIVYSVVNATCCATSTVGTASPSHTPIHDIA